MDGGGPGSLGPGKGKLRPLTPNVRRSEGVNDVRRSDNPPPPPKRSKLTDEMVLEAIHQLEPTTYRQLCAHLGCGREILSGCIHRLRAAGKVTPPSKTRGGFIISVKE